MGGQAATGSTARYRKRPPLRARRDGPGGNGSSAGREKAIRDLGGKRLAFQRGVGEI